MVVASPHSITTSLRSAAPEATMPIAVQPTPDESRIVDTLFAQGEQRDLGFLPGDIALELFNKTKLPVETLHAIWSIADEESRGFLTPQQTLAAVRLCGWAQAGKQPSLQLLENPGPLAHFPDATAAVAETISRPPPVPPLTAEDKAKFRKLFVSGEPVNGLIYGVKAREMFSKSNLSEKQLSKIWQLADTQRRGALDVTDFAIAMHLVQWLMNGDPLTTLPESLPAGLYEQAAAQTSSPLPTSAKTNGFLSVDTEFKPRTPSPSLSPPRPPPSPSLDPSRRKSRSFISTPSPSPSPSRLSLSPAANPTNASRRPAHSLLPTPSPSPRSRASPPLEWELTAEFRTRADRQFDLLDPLKNGYIFDSISLPFLMESKLPPEELSAIWILADANGDRKLNRHGFAIALYLVEQRIRGRNIPSTLPHSLKPPLPVLEAPVVEKPPQIPPKSPIMSPTSPVSAGSIRRRPPPPPQKPANLSPPITVKTPDLRLPSAPTTEPLAIPSDAIRRRASSVIYPTLPSQANNQRFSSLWPQEDKPQSQLPTKPLANLAVNPQEIIIGQLIRRIQDMQAAYTQLLASNAEQTKSLSNAKLENESLRVIVDELQTQVASNDPASQRAVNQVLVAENEGLRQALEVTKDELQQLQTTRSDAELQRIHVEDLERDNERLQRQVTEMRESTTQLPWSGGDSELQTLINEDLARENARLRTEARDMQEEAGKLQEQLRVNAELEQANERLRTEGQTIRTQFETQRREFRQVSRELERRTATADLMTPVDAQSLFQRHSTRDIPRHESRSTPVEVTQQQRQTAHPSAKVLPFVLPPPAEYPPNVHAQVTSPGPREYPLGRPFQLRPLDILHPKVIRRGQLTLASDGADDRFTDIDLACLFSPEYARVHDPVVWRRDLLRVLGNTQSHTQGWDAYLALTGAAFFVPYNHLERLVRLLARERTKTRHTFSCLLHVLTTIRRSGWALKSWHWNALIDNAGKGFRRATPDEFKSAFDIFVDMVVAKPPGTTFNAAENETSLARGDLENPTPDVYTYTTLINLATETRSQLAIDQTVSLLDAAAIAPNRTTFLVFLKHAGRARTLNGLRESLAAMRYEQKPLGIDGVNACIWAYSKHSKYELVRRIYRLLRHNMVPETAFGPDDIHSARQVMSSEFVEIPETMLPNAVTYTLMVQSSAYHGHLREALQTFRDMLSSRNIEIGAPLYRDHSGELKPSSYSPTLPVFRALFLGFFRHGIPNRTTSQGSQVQPWSLDALIQILDVFLSLPPHIKPSASTVYWLLIAFHKTSTGDPKMVATAWKRVQDHFGEEWAMRRRIRNVRSHLVRRSEFEERSETAVPSHKDDSHPNGSECDAAANPFQRSELET
ncbi:hypothetical protein MKEN_00053800 [Mycena kentingensis (nom. inval.)]|nr:hypothetical protein MKEN_00053800 [Mycena kentingensis (nom. inval.)]